MKIAHISDLHCCKEHAEAALASLRTLAAHIESNPVDLIAISGDTWDASILSNESSGYNDFIEAIRDIANIAPVVMIYGTPSHDTDGSLDIFRKLICRNGITILDPGKAYFYSTTCTKEVYREGDISEDTNIPEAIIFGIPEPRKKYLLANNSAGKDETEEAIREAMHRLCFTLAAKRKEYKDIPCIVLYHGDVSGCTLQNDQTIERGTGISITSDDLNDIGGDYYALGHIHKPQQVGDLPAYYAGSIYPKDFGEAHKAGFNVVEFKETDPHYFDIDVERVDFPHPENYKMELNCKGDVIPTEMWTSICTPFTTTGRIEGKKVWVEITCTREQRSHLDTEKILQDLLDHGAVSGSRVTICETAVETVRAAEIAEVNTPEKKFEVWAKNSNLTVKDSHIKKIAELEAELTRGTVKAEGEWELVSLRLKGAIGIMKGIKKEGIEINFDDIPDGVIALTGDNGKGKTTLIENCHPYPQLLTRTGTLQNHFMLKDSYREVVYRNRQFGTMRKFLIQIDGKNKSGSCKYFIFSKGAESADWTALPGVDGNLKQYEEVLASTFGSIDLFQRTAFITQKSTKKLPDITDATAGEKKALFVALAGIDYLQNFADTANERAKTEAAKTHDAEIKMQMLKAEIDKKPAEEESLDKLQKSIEAKNKELADITKQGLSAKDEVEKCQTAWNAEQLRQQKETAAKNAVETLETDICALADEIDKLKEYSENKAKYEGEIADYEAQQKIINAENAKKQAVAEANLKIQRDFIDQNKIYDEKLRSEGAKKEPLIKSRTERESIIKDAENGIKLFERDAQEIDENCPECGQKLPPQKLAELKARSYENTKKIAAQNEIIDDQRGKIKEINQQIEQIEAEIFKINLNKPIASEYLQFDGSFLKDAIDKQKKINIEASRAALTQAQESTVRIEGIQKQIDEKHKQRKTKEAEYKSVKQDAEVGAKIKSDLDAAAAKKADLTEKYTTVKTEIAGIDANITSTKLKIEGLAQKENDYSSLEKSNELAVIAAQEWELITKAFGKDGIQALELDALAPGISNTANRILESAYGDRFRIDIQTTRIGGVGKKVKQIEDFLIYVIDSEDGEAVLLDDKSGGEAVWIKRAIYDAFAVIRKRNTNFAFLTCFQDETDGALDSAAKTAYCRMLEAAHKESNLRHTIIITHSNEVKAMIEQQINLEDL
jgi:DNA repair protein SbcC/Rad50